MTSQPRSYSTSEVAKRLGISTQTVQRWVDSGQLKAWKTMGGHRRIEAEGAELLFRLHGLGVAPAHSGEAETSSSTGAQTEALSVLIVDDNPDDREILVHLLEDALPSAQVAATTNGFHGLIAVGRMVPDILITDLLMPHMNGFEMLRHLRTGCAVPPRLIVAVSSNSLHELAAKGTLPEGVLFMQKPLDPDEFTHALRDAIQHMPHTG
ncbi:MAG TPA: response regulator [Aquabacterium sp.]|nr:response regulator [Aquabacterium sp.]